MNIAQEVAVLQYLDIQQENPNAPNEELFNRTAESSLLLEPIEQDQLKDLVEEWMHDSNKSDSKLPSNQVSQNDNDARKNLRKRLRNDVLKDLAEEIQGCEKKLESLYEEVAKAKAKAVEDQLALEEADKEAKKAKTEAPVEAANKSLRSRKKTPEIAAPANIEPEVAPTTKTPKKRAALSNEEKQSLKKFQSAMLPMLDNISNHRFGAPFSHPVNRKEAPDYDSLVYKPQDLRTLKNMIKEGNITEVDELYREVLRIFANCKMYNGSDPANAMSIWGDECFRYTEELFDIYRQASTRSQ